MLLVNYLKPIDAWAAYIHISIPAYANMQDLSDTYIFRYM